jgi:hypothetical protein
VPFAVAISQKSDHPAVHHTFFCTACSRYPA